MKSNYLFTKKHTTIFFSFFVFLFCCAFNSLATTYYISPSGNDATGTGTISNPWKTLKKATATVNAPGDIIHVNPGTYNETLQSFLAVGVSVEGEGTTSIIKSTISGVNTCTIDVRSAEGTNGNQHISGIKMDGNNLTANWAIWVGGRSNVSIHDCTIVDFFNQGVMFGGRQDGYLAPPAIYATGNKFYNNTVTNCAQYGTGADAYGRGCLGLGGQTGMLIYNNVITQDSRPGGSNGWPVKYWNDGYLKGCKIYNNTFTKNLHRVGEDWSFALELFNLMGTEIHHNTIQGSSDFNFQGNKDIYPYTVYFHDNIVTVPAVQGPVQEGVIIEFDADNFIIENNLFENIAQGVAFYPRGGTLISNISIRKNLFKNLGCTSTSGYMVGGFGGALGSFNISNLQIFNNTAIGSNTGKPDFAIMITGPIISADAVLVRNNIFQNFIFTPYIIQNRTLFTNCSFQYNNHYLNGDNVNLTPTWVTPVTNFPASTIVSNNISVNPMYVGNGDYRLTTGSPMIDAGINVGLPYAGVAPDRGYAEVSLILPIKLTDITVTENNGKNILQWKTATESNSDYFNVERSSNGQSFEVIGRVSATGFSTNDISYSFTDVSPLTGINYYRLSMVDKDNSSEYSKIVSTSAKKYQSLSIAAAQLPAGKNSIIAAVASTKNQKATLILFDATGRALITEGIALQKGLNTFNRNTGTIPGGIYYLKIFTADENAVKNIFSNN
jgi:Right handed beta helix region